MLSEKELEDFIFNAIETDKDALLERGFPMPDFPKFYRQVKLGDYGVVDFLAVGEDNETGKLEIFLYELKKERVGAINIPQICKYMGGIVDWLGHNDYEREDYDLYGVLMAPEVDTFLSYFIGSDIQFYSIKYNPFKGIEFKREMYGAFSGLSCKTLDIEIPLKPIEVEKTNKSPKKSK